MDSVNSGCGFMPQDRVLVSFQFTGTTADERALLLAPPINKLQKAGVDWFCSNEWERHFQDNNFTNREIYDFCLAKQRTCSRVLFIFNNRRISSGMQEKLALAIKLGQPAHVLIGTDCKTYKWMQPFIDYANSQVWV